MTRGCTKTFAAFRLDTVNECLWRRRDTEDERILLTPKAFAVLQFLVEHAGCLVTEDELLAAAWPRVCVQPEAIKTRIHEIRKALEDDAKNSRFIETLPRRGYRFIALVSDTVAAMHAAAEGASPRLVGREMQLLDLQACLARTSTNRREIVFITGETGIGKTTLADAFTQRAAAELPGIRIARGQCLDGHGSKEPYYPVLEAIGQLCRAADGATPQRILSTLAPTWLVQFPDLVAREQRERFHQEILGATRGRMLREILEALEALSSEKPLLMVLEDLHWADPCTVDFISTLARRRGTGKIMLIATYRPIDVPVAHLSTVKQDLLVHQLCREIALNPLTEAQVAEYLALEAADPPAGIAALIYRHSEGNPLFMVAVLDHMIHRNMIGIEDGTWRLKTALKSIDMDAPESLRRLIELQIERLSAEEQRVLEIASVAGVTFTVQANALGTRVSAEDFEGVCEGLARRQVMLRRANHSQDGASADRYEFVHALYRNVFYLRQTLAHRTMLERRIGEWAGDGCTSP